MHIHIHHRLQRRVLEYFWGVARNFTDQSKHITLQGALDNTPLLTVKTHVKFLLVQFLGLQPFVNNFKPVENWLCFE